MSDQTRDKPGTTSGVLLFNLGGPETMADVRPFLFNLFSDPDIIRVRNDALRKSLAWLIATTRQRKSRDLYRQIGGGSPLRRITEEQARALSIRLAERGCPRRVYVGMQCWKPSIQSAIEKILSDQIRQLVVLPLFPQFSVTTTGSCLKHFDSLLAEQGVTAPRTHTIREWYADPHYLEAMADTIRETAEQFSIRQDIHILYSAHSIPERYVTEGDPYQSQTEETVTRLNAALGNEFSWSLAYQSKVGPVKWLGPATKDVIVQLGREGRRVLVVPISFVSDHIETLQEIDILYRDLAQQSGIREFRRAPALNSRAKFIDALASLATDGFEQF